MTQRGDPRQALIDIICTRTQSLCKLSDKVEDLMARLVGLPEDDYFELSLRSKSVFLVRDLFLFWVRPMLWLGWALRRRIDARP